ncbi:uncharacterized protein LOC125676854 [Ostrea edulis]|uniref:uncharacterized protein LOC125676854 n=1 Tax=Ostrea edulis TaxID=37623 RepID=UPI0024AED1D5|nr:uncharacterized protein LOC125676854 [Ostrea edulis]
MWKFIILIGLISIGCTVAQGQQGQGSQFNSPCLQMFDQLFRKCFMDNGNFKLESIFSLVTNGSSGPLPSGTSKQQLTQTVCGNRQTIDTCVKPIIKNMNVKCSDREKMMMDSTVQSTGRAIAVMCGVTPEMPPCLKKFDENFKACMTQQKVNQENYFKLLANQTEGTGMTFKQLRDSTCNKPTQQIIVGCASGGLQSLANECTKQEQFMVGQTLQNMMASYQAVCTGQPLVGPGRAPSPCLQKFESKMNQCSINSMSAPLNDIMILLTRGQVPEGQDMKELNKTICENFHAFEECGKKVVIENRCKGKDLLISEGTFANVIITVGAYCHDTTVPGACMLTLQQQFTKCFSKVGLDPAVYFSNITSHKGAILGTTEGMAKKYCSEKSSLYTCMKKVMHQCPGAEQTMSMTGFDLVSMERAVGILCDDIPEYLAGINCFEQPSNEAQVCIANMGRAITQMSANQMAKGISIDGFLNEFCKIRVDHVTCDSKAWPTCDSRAIALKTKFECHLLPMRCHDVREGEIAKVCPPDSRIKPHTCVDDVKVNIGSCLAPYNIDPETFIVNVTHDRSSMLGGRSQAQRFCQNRNSVLKCLRETVDSCAGASEVLAFWGHQQDLLDDALDLLCKNIDGYEQLTACAAGASSQINQCQKNSEMKMGDLTKLRPNTQMSATYYAQFCSVRLEQLQCDLKAVRSSCDAASIGLKTEFECNLIQDRCQGLRRSEFKRICNVNNYARSNRGQTSGGGSQNTNSNNRANTKGGQQGGNSANGLFSFSATLVTMGLSLLVLL